MPQSVATGMAIASANPLRLRLPIDAGIRMSVPRDAAEGRPRSRPGASISERVAFSARTRPELSAAGRPVRQMRIEPVEDLRPQVAHVGWRRDDVPFTPVAHEARALAEA